MKSLIPVVMAGILGIYGMIVAVILSQRSTFPPIQSKIPLITLRRMPFLIWLLGWYAASVAL